MGTSNITVGNAANLGARNNRFGFSPGQLGQLNKLKNPKSLAVFHALGGLRGLEKGLQTDIRYGLKHNETFLDGTAGFDEITTTGSDNKQVRAPQQQENGLHCGKQLDRSLDDRKQVFGDNSLPRRTGRPLWELIWLALKDWEIARLAIIAVAFLVREFYQGDLDWFNITTATAFATIVSLYYWQKESKSRRSKNTRNYREIKVIRSGKSMLISVCDILVGDVVCLEPGDVIPVDGILIEGFGVKCDESFHTGESDAIRKRTIEDFPVLVAQTMLSKMDPFILSGAKVLEGVGTFLVTATGARSVYGQRLISLLDDQDRCSMTAQSSPLASFETGLGLAEAIILLYRVGRLDETAWAHGHDEIVALLITFSFLAAKEWMLRGIGIYGMYSTSLVKQLMTTSERQFHILEWNTPAPKYFSRSSIGTLLSKFSSLILSIPLVPFQPHSPGSATLPVIINGQKVHAIPDTGADENVISTACVLQLGLTIERDPDPTTFKLANGRCVLSCGLVRSSFTFARGANKLKAPAVFKVFPTLAVPLIMGRKFLRDTKTLTKHDDRLQKISNSRAFGLPRIFHLNPAKQRLRCYLDGIPVYANADTGAEMNLASPKWASKNRMVLRKPEPGYERVMLADGSIAHISGQFTARFHVFQKGSKGSTPKVYTKQFFILEGLTSDVLLCQDLLLEIRAFKEQQKAFIELNNADTFSDLNLVSWLSKRERRFLAFFKRDSPSKSPPKPPVVSFQQQLDVDAAREQHRHTEALRGISTLAEPERQNRLKQETQRYEAFLYDHSARMKAYHAMKVAIPGNSLSSRTSSPSHAPSANASSMNSTNDGAI
ncbi:uncharacterized protein N7500_002949 [Penicillium coprophilum]|uniref:uncharacterized protein n=1 Tax=Penicillium coprophilum TaxID=36646 RepID=UPI00238DD612|nr:uncharacterized protein N7500_002949 [Penicillium coprophilum]KAJ5170166.1 hypothetical protein N7500_002949 [Penicillium coprophilum]